MKDGGKKIKSIKCVTHSFAKNMILIERKTKIGIEIIQNPLSDSEEDCEDVLNEDVEEELRDEEDGIEEVKPKDRIHTSDDTEIYKLPNLIKLINIQRGEAPYMKRKRIPNAIRFHKIKDHNSHEWLYTQILLYRPFQNELDDLKAEREEKDACEDTFLHPATPTMLAEDENAIQKSNVIQVRKKVMPFIVDVQEAREQVASLNAERIGEQIDAENVQDNEDCNMAEPEIHPDFETQHTDFMEKNQLNLLLQYLHTIE